MFSKLMVKVRYFWVWQCAVEPVPTPRSTGLLSSPPSIFAQSHFHWNRLGKFLCIFDIFLHWVIHPWWWCNGRILSALSGTARHLSKPASRAYPVRFMYSVANPTISPGQQDSVQYISGTVEAFAKWRLVTLINGRTDTSLRLCPSVGRDVTILHLNVILEWILLFSYYFFF